MSGASHIRVGEFVHECQLWAAFEDSLDIHLFEGYSTVHGPTRWNDLERSDGI